MIARPVQSPRAAALAELDRAMAVADVVAATGAEIMRRAGYEPEPWQAEAVDSPRRRLVLICARQAGKTTVFAAAAVRHALRPSSTILVVAPVFTQAREVYERIGLYLDRLGLYGTALDPDDHQKRETRLRNGSRIIVRSGHKPENVRSLSGLAAVIVDEAAFIDDGLVPSLLPMLARSGGQLLLGGTPFGARGTFWEVATNQRGKGDEYHRIEIRGEDSQALSALRTESGRPFLESARAEMDEFWYEQEFGCKFHAPQGALFTPEMIEAARENRVPPLVDAPYWHMGGEPTAEGGSPWVYDEPTLDVV